MAPCYSYFIVLCLVVLLKNGEAGPNKSLNRAVPFSSQGIITAKIKLEEAKAGLVALLDIKEELFPAKK